MANQLIIICNSINSFDRKKEKKMMQSIKSYMLKEKIKLYKDDETEDILVSFNVNLSEKDLKTITDYINNKYTNRLFDHKSFTCYLAYTIRSIIDERKLLVDLDLPIGGYSDFKENIIKRVS